MHPHVPLFRLATVLGIASLTIGGFAQTPPPKPPEQKPAETKPADAKPAQPAKPPKPGEPKPYKEVITAEAKTEKGLFTVHRIDDKVYFEIPTAMYDRDMLWQTEIAQTGGGAGFGGTHVGEKVIRWSRHNNTIFMRSISYAMRGDGKTAIQRAVDDTNVAPIIAFFPVLAEGENKSAVIDVTRFYADDGGPVPAGAAIGGGADPSRSYVERIKAFPTNIEGHSVITFNRGNGAVTTTAHYSLVLLPEHPMQGRYFDSRVGYFTTPFADYGSNEHRVVDREYVTRYRLVKKDPTAKISDPVQPLVYYVSREVPEKWRKYVKMAIEDWQPAFEQAGFSHAIIAKDAPTEQEDPNWDPEDARYSVIRWVAQPVENAMGPNVHDPRSGEILSAHVIVWHDVEKLAEQWYFVQCADLDPRAQKLPIPDELMGQILRYIICHEVGHTLGLRHNHKASSSYTVAQLRDKAFTEKYGDEASIMDYGRFNYVAQPGDNARLIPLLGPYDKFAIEWGYTPIPGATNPEAEKSALDLIAARQLRDPMLRFGGEDRIAGVDPTVQTEDLGSDPIDATAYGLKNIDRIVPLLIPATTKFGDDYSQLGDIYGQLINQRFTELMHVAKLVGGVVEARYHAGRGDAVFTPVPKEEQQRAVRFLLANAFTTPKSLLIPSILNRIEFTGATDQVLAEQTVMLNILLNEARMRRMEENEVMAKQPVYTVSQLMADLQNGIWSELNTPAPTIDLYRRNLQRVYLKSLQPRLAGSSASQSDFRPIAAGSLRALQAKVDVALTRTKDTATLLHLRDCKTQIENILNPKFAEAGNNAGNYYMPYFLHFEENLPEAHTPSFECDLFSEKVWLKNLIQAGLSVSEQK